jgi:hypothetical protein
MVALAVAVVGIVAGSVTGALSVPGLDRLQELFRGLPEPRLSLDGPAPDDPALAFSLELFSYRDEHLPLAREMKEELEGRLPELLFSIIPVNGRGRVGFLLLAGPAQNRSQAEALRNPLAGVLTREDPYGWSVRETPRAFFLGERDTLEDAQDLRSVLETNEIDPYILQVGYADGSQRYRVLTGAFDGVRAAQRLQQLLLEVGIDDPPLIERRGRLPE